MSVFDSIDSVFGADFANGPTVNPQYQPLQPKREWVGLTVMEAVELELATNHPREFAAAIEAKLKEKNNG
jgi:hypothetical protein